MFFLKNFPETFADSKISRTFASLLKKSASRKKFWRDGRVVDCGGLENRCTARYRGFESLSLRKNRQVKFSNLFEDFTCFFFARRLTAARGWTCQSLSLRQLVGKKTFLSTFFMSISFIRFAFTFGGKRQHVSINPLHLIVLG